MMLERLKIQDLRGIETLEMTGFAPLTVLTGPNGCGKSTILDALLLVGAQDPVGGLERVLTRRRAVRDPASWVVRRGARARQTTVEGSWTGALVRTSHFVERFDVPPEKLRIELSEAGPWRGVMLGRSQAKLQGRTSVLGIGPDGRCALAKDPRIFGVPPLPDARLLDPSDPAALAQSFASAIKRGTRDRLDAFARTLEPSIRTLTTLVEDDGSSALYLEYADRAVPTALCGDGVQAALQIAIEIAATGAELVLIEEPEVFQHPAGMARIARVLVEACLHGTQIVLTTHSLEMLDAVLDAAADRQVIESCAVFLMGPGQPGPSWRRRAGEELLTTRRELGADLR